MKRNKHYVAIIDYQMSNLYSVKHACDFLKIASVITSNPRDILEAYAAILPGVGAFGEAMSNLRRLSLVHPIKQFIQSKKPFMGICLGMQLLFDKSYEFGQHTGLGILSGDVIRFTQKNQNEKQIKTPHIGWNTIYAPNGRNWKETPLTTIKDTAYMYFVHSYYVKPKRKNIVLSLTSYEGIQFCSAALDKNIFAVQFHPEKSGTTGLEIYKKWYY